MLNENGDTALFLFHEDGTSISSSQTSTIFIDASIAVVSFKYSLRKFTQ
jgi:hypothetical protein